MPRTFRKLAFVLGIGVGLAALASILPGIGSKRHQFEGQCQLCHETMPRLGAPIEEVTLTDEVDRLCARCHSMPEESSHPVGVAPRMTIPLQRYLDNRGRLTCITCHDVHKEEHEALDAGKTAGLLRGHVRGRAFCATCHQQELLGASWRHGLAVSFAHASGRLAQKADGAALDEFSAECLSCHDGAISQRGAVSVREGLFRHGADEPSHSVGVAYPRGPSVAGYVPLEELPESIRLFDGKVGCLSCHNLYSSDPAKLAMEMTGSALCLACHRK